MHSSLETSLKKEIKWCKANKNEKKWKLQRQGRPMHCPHDSNFQNFTVTSYTEDKDGRFERIKKIGNLRMAQPSDSAYRMESVCVGLPDVLEPRHGYHCDCYQRFTANLKRLHNPEKKTLGQVMVRE